jgi:hypothetical protein
MAEIEIIARVPKEPVGWLEIKLPKDVIMKLQSYIETAKKNPVNVNHHLAGNISKSLTIKDEDGWFFYKTVVPFIKKFYEWFPEYTKGLHVLTEEAPFCLNDFWVNFQKENEFNPMHEHSGIFSFVVWVKIPTDWREQHALPISANSREPSASDFVFCHTTMFGQTIKTKYKLDKESEGGMLFFPSTMMHEVYPFYNCDEERISISGNISIDISENTMKQFRSQQTGIDDQKSM